MIEGLGIRLNNSWNSQLSKQGSSLAARGTPISTNTLERTINQGKVGKEGLIYAAGCSKISEAWFVMDEAFY